MSSTLVAAGWGGLVVACCWVAREVVLHRRLGTWRTDPVTGLPVRRAFYRRAHRAIRRPCMVVLLIDLDRFKPINDHLGHHVGDHVLASVGARLRATLGRGAVLGRLGGDEFAAVVRVGAVDTPWPDLLLHLVHELHTPIAVPGVQRPVTVGVSVGAIHCADLNRPALSALLQTAEGLMYQAKRGGGGLVASVADPADAQLIRPVPCRPRRRRRDALATPAESPPRHRSPNCRTR